MPDPHRTPKPRGRPSKLPVFPHPHFMGLAPLDVWIGMLARGEAWRRVHPRYCVRLAWCLFTSALSTVLTLPERLVFALWRAAHRRVKPADPAEVVCILGYFRSGTTHLHYLLSCDPASATPRWYQCLAPQGWVVSWAFLRWFLVPFLGSTRPQDDVAIGPEWPAEDDFALCNWSLSSSMPGRMVLPGEWDRTWKRMHGLDGVGARAMSAWRESVVGFAAKVGGGSDRRVLLKNPSHTARIRELVQVFGADRVRFIHIARRPEQVVRSNVAMHERFGPYLLQELPDRDELRRRIIEEYDATERAMLVQAAELPSGSFASIRYQDLIADPLAELRRVYADLGWPWNDDLQARLSRYLREVASYRAASDRPWTEPSGQTGQSAEDVPELGWMLAKFGHDRPTRERIAPPADVADDPPRASRAAAVLDPLIAALLVASAWIGIAFVLRDRLDWFTWPAGVMIGSVALRAVGTGTLRLGVWAAMLTLGTMLAVAYPATCLAFYRDRSPMPWGDVWDSTRDGLLAINNLVWIFLGVMTAYRFASRKHVRPPGADGAG